MQNTDEKDLLTTDAVKQQLSDLSPASMGFLLKWAKIYAAGTGLEPQEMLHNCIVKFLSGERHAPNAYSLTTTLKNAMRSMADNDRRKHINDSNWLSNDPIRDGEDKLDLVENFPSDDPPIEGEVAGEQLAQIIKKYLAHDDFVMQILDSRFHRYTKHEACEKLNLSSENYDAAVKRMRRTIDKHYGRQSYGTGQTD